METEEKNKKILLVTAGLILLGVVAAYASTGSGSRETPPPSDIITPEKEFDILSEIIIKKFETNYIKDEVEESKWGLTKANYPNLDIKNLTYEQAITYLRKDYWEKIKAAQFNSNIKLLLYDMAINQGQPTAIRTIQRLGGAKVDGRVGEETIEKSRLVTAEQLRDKREAMYRELAKKPKYKKYLDGWLTRLNYIYEKTKTLKYA